ncbi:DR2241 family protein [Halohasta litorea]|uniref:DR2241 family protein n=1 Tax=Halohasta litorea TaxID=869891 RepID=A0ABD6D4H7_9EURY|nr:DR2241 family protein [Halohasta litorea]
MSVVEPTLSETQLAAFREQLADGVIDHDGLAADYDADENAYHIETPDRQTTVSADGLETVPAEQAAYITNWYFYTQQVGTEIKQAFCQWLEQSDERPVPDRYAALESGIEREWGQLEITTTVSTDGTRHYEIRHVDDSDAEASALTAHTDPFDARDIGTLDADDRYRPLRTAPSLKQGWIFPELSANGVYDAVEAFYPATVVNWYREGRGELDIDHWQDEQDRQSGIYNLITVLPDEAVDWAAAACCDDSQCLKRREWELSEDEPLDADGGDGVFPCRGPCSMVVAAGREWAKLEREDSQTYEFELTPTEKEQLEAIIDAVADDELDEIREADIGNGANRYRVRYLREKRFDEDGNLSGTPTHPDAHDEGPGDDDHDEEADQN